MWINALELPPYISKAEINESLGSWDCNITPSYLVIFTVHSGYPRYYEELYFSLYNTNGSTRPPMINAIEVYKVRESEQLTTIVEDGMS